MGLILAGGLPTVMSMPYPVTFEADYVESRSRLSVFFRGLVLIPLYVWLWLYGIAAYLAVMVAWFVIVITGRLPEGLYAFIAGFVRVLSLTTAFGALLTDRYPPFSPAPDDTYPVRMHFAGPLPRYSRLRTLFRAILSIPLSVLRYAATLGLQILSFAAWCAIVVLGRMPRGLFEVLFLINSYIARSDAYLLLLTETYPPFSAAEAAEPSRPADTTAPGMAGGWRG
jgi:hypothetical protein